MIREIEDREMVVVARRANSFVIPGVADLVEQNRDSAWSPIVLSGNLAAIFRMTWELTSRC